MTTPVLEAALPDYACYVRVVEHDGKKVMEFCDLEEYEDPESSRTWTDALDYDPWEMFDYEEFLVQRQAFLDEANNALGTSYTMEDFVG